MIEKEYMRYYSDVQICSSIQLYSVKDPSIACK